MNNVVKIERPTTAADVALVLIDNPPVNAIGTEMLHTACIPIT